MQNKHMKQRYKRIVPQEITLGEGLQSRRYGFKRRLVLQPEQFYYVPILESLEQYLQDGGIFQSVLSSPFQHRSGFLQDFCDGHLFNANPVLTKKNALILILYYDDIELCCPLGSKSRKLSCFYYSLGNIPKPFRSSLKSIRLLGLCERTVLDKYGIDKILEPFVSDLKNLESGYQFNIQDEIVELSGGLYIILGDTPANHLLGGFKESVGLANQKCRMCYCNYDRMQTKFSETDFKLRDPDEYISECNNIENAETQYMRSYLSTLYGINRRTILSTIPHFDVTSCLPQDVMHVILEGLAPYEVKETLKFYINEQGTFPLKEFNSKVNIFQYGYHEMKSKLSPVTSNTLNSLDNRLKQNASQMHLLLQIILFILLQLNVDSGDINYKLIVSLVEMCKLIMAPVLSLGSISTLREMVQSHLKLFKRCYPNCPIIPKQHYLVHLATCMKNHGPCSGFSCMRFEGKNKVPKSISKFKNNFINVAKTITNEMMNLEALNSHVDSDLFSSGNCTTELTPGPSTHIDGDKLQYFCNKLESFYDIQAFDGMNVYTCKHVTYHGTKYITDRAFLASAVHNDGILPEFGKLTSIYIVNLYDIYFELMMYQTICYDETVQSYMVEEPNSAEGLVLCKIPELLDHHVYTTVGFNGSLYMRSNYDLTDLIASRLNE